MAIEVIIRRVLRPPDTRMDPRETDEIWIRLTSEAAIKSLALSGIDMALSDILGKARSLPLDERVSR
jgi:L-alanine-DL-glutamate epimerase-like enolase superfamily enzyme